MSAVTSLTGTKLGENERNADRSSATAGCVSMTVSVVALAFILTVGRTEG